MNIEKFLKLNNPPRGETVIFYCGQSFLDAFEKAFEKLTPEVKTKIVNRYVNKVSKT